MLCEAAVTPAPRFARPGRTRIVFISDLHWNGRQWPIYRKLAENINELDADWIAFGGDLSVFMDTVQDALDWLATLNAKRGKIAVKGNRESPISWLDDKFWRTAYKRAGYVFLCNQRIVDLNAHVAFYGIDDRRFGKPDWTPAQTSDNPFFTVSLSHNPDAAADAPLSTFIGDIVLCGHTHGGQLNLPFWGPIYSSSSYGRQFVHGWQQRDDGALCLTSSGIGESGFGILRHRLLCPREFVMLDIEP